MQRLVVSAAARRDISNALQHSFRRWGLAQRRQYRALIDCALGDLLENSQPPASRARDDIRAGIRTLHIARQGRAARHFIVYRIAPDGDIHVIRLLHDAMEFSRALTQAP